jgi:hypothetical protein
VPKKCECSKSKWISTYAAYKPQKKIIFNTIQSVQEASRHKGRLKEFEINDYRVVHAITHELFAPLLFSSLTGRSAVISTSSTKVAVVAEKKDASVVKASISRV